MSRRCATAVAFVALLSSTTIAQEAKTVLANVYDATASSDYTQTS